LSRGHELVVVGRGSEEKFRQRFKLECEYQAWDKLMLTNVQAVYHLAGDSIAGDRWTSKKKASILNSRTETTKKLAKAFEGQWPDVFIGASAIGYYGDRADETLTELSPPGLGFLADVCKQWEASSQAFEKNSRVVRFRIGVVLDSDGGFLKPMKKLFSLGLGGRVGDGKQWMSWIHSEDLIQMFLFALENPIKGEFNATAPTPIRNSEWTRVFAKQLNIPAIIPAPEFALKIILGEMSQLATASQNVSSEKIVGRGFKFKYKDIRTALSHIYP
jgi:uncharacterized protein (TIGR01777 family)